MEFIHSRRNFLASASLAAAAGVLGARASLADEGPPETTAIRLALTRAICLAPVYIAQDLLRAEGITDVRYVPSPLATVGRGEIDFDFQYGAWIASHLDAGEPLTALGGRAFRVSRGVRPRAHPNHWRPERQEGWRPKTRRG